jgi:hypothetical protein
MYFSNASLYVILHNILEFRHGNVDFFSSEFRSAAVIPESKRVFKIFVHCFVLLARNKSKVLVLHEGSCKTSALGLLIQRAFLY